MWPWRCAVVQALHAHDEEQRNTSHEVLQQCQLLSWFVFINRCCCFNLGRDWCILHRGADLPRDAINLFPSTDMSGLIQHRHTNNNAVFNAFFFFSIFLLTGVIEKKKIKIHLYHFNFQKGRYWGAGLQMFTCPDPVGLLINEKSAILFTMAATMIDLLFLSETLFILEALYLK